jgi:hypothetical protein
MMYGCNAGDRDVNVGMFPIRPEPTSATSRNRSLPEKTADRAAPAPNTANGRAGVPSEITDSNASMSVAGLPVVLSSVTVRLDGEQLGLLRAFAGAGSK